MDFDRDELWEATREDRLRRWRSYPEGLHEPEAKKVFQDDSPTEADAFSASPKKRRMRRRRFFEEDDDAAAEASDDAASSSDASDDDSLSSPSSSRSSEWITSDGGTRFRWEYATPPFEDGVAMGAEWEYATPPFEDGVAMGAEWEWESGSDFDDADADAAEDDDAPATTPTPPRTPSPTKSELYAIEAAKHAPGDAREPRRSLSLDDDEDEDDARRRRRAPPVGKKLLVVVRAVRGDVLAEIGSSFFVAVEAGRDGSRFCEVTEPAAVAPRDAPRGTPSVVPGAFAFLSGRPSLSIPTRIDARLATPADAPPNSLRPDVCRLARTLDPRPSVVVGADPLEIVFDDDDDDRDGSNSNSNSTSNDDDAISLTVILERAADGAEVEVARASIAASAIEEDLNDGGAWSATLASEAGAWLETKTLAWGVEDGDVDVRVSMTLKPRDFTPKARARREMTRASREVHVAAARALSEAAMRGAIERAAAAAAAARATDPKATFDVDAAARVAVLGAFFSHWSPYDRVRVVNADP